MKEKGEKEEQEKQKEKGEREREKWTQIQSQRLISRQAGSRQANKQVNKQASTQISKQTDRHKQRTRKGDSLCHTTKSRDYLCLLESLLELCGPQDHLTRGPCDLLHLRAISLCLLSLRENRQREKKYINKLRQGISAEEQIAEEGLR